MSKTLLGALSERPDVVICRGMRLDIEYVFEETNTAIPGYGTTGNWGSVDLSRKLAYVNAGPSGSDDVAAHNLYVVLCTLASAALGVTQSQISPHSLVRTMRDMELFKAGGLIYSGGN